MTSKEATEMLLTFNRDVKRLADAQDLDEIEGILLYWRNVGLKEATEFFMNTMICNEISPTGESPLHESVSWESVSEELGISKKD